MPGRRLAGGSAGARHCTGLRITAWPVCCHNCWRVPVLQILMLRTLQGEHGFARFMAHGGGQVLLLLRHDVSSLARSPSADTACLPSACITACLPHCLPVCLPACPFSRETALLLAARRGHHTAVELLLQHGASTEKANRGGVTPLIASSLFGHDSAVAALLARCVVAGVASSTLGLVQANLRSSWYAAACMTSIPFVGCSHDRKSHLAAVVMTVHPECRLSGPTLSPCTPLCLQGGCHCCIRLHAPQDATALGSAGRRRRIGTHAA